MKSSVEIINLPLLAVKQGAEEGKVIDFIINPVDKKIAYLVVESGHWYLGAKVIKFTDILNIGKDAIVTDSEDNIVLLSSNNDALRLFNLGVKINGARSFTNKGYFIGKIKDFSFSEEDGTISSCTVENENQDVINLSDIITFGKDMIVVNKDSKFNEISKSQEIGKIDMKPVNAKIIKEEKPAQETKSENDNLNLFEKKQRQFLVGRKASKDISDDKGKKIIEDGQVITEELIDRAKSCGKLVELTMNTKS